MKTTKIHIRHKQRVTMRTETRIIDEQLAEDVKALVGHLGHRSVNAIINKALTEYVKKYAKEIKQIKAQK